MAPPPAYPTIKALRPMPGPGADPEQQSTSVMGWLHGAVRKYASELATALVADKAGEGPPPSDAVVQRLERGLRQALLVGAPPGVSCMWDQLAEMVYEKAPKLLNSDEAEQGKALRQLLRRSGDLCDQFERFGFQLSSVLGFALAASQLTLGLCTYRLDVALQQSGASVELLAAVKQLLRKNSPALLLERDPTATYFCAEVALRVLEGSNLGVDLEMLYGLRLGQGSAADMVGGYLQVLVDQIEGRSANGMPVLRHVSHMGVDAVEIAVQLLLTEGEPLGTFRHVIQEAAAYLPAVVQSIMDLKDTTRLMWELLQSFAAANLEAPADLRDMLAVAMALLPLLDAEAFEHLFVDFLLIPGRLPLDAAHWALVPAPCMGIGSALPTALACSPAQAAQVVRRLPPADAARLRTTALCLGRSILPGLVAGYVLARLFC